MSYELADGSMSTDYKVGDKFTHKYERGVFIFVEDDGTLNPWFKSEEIHREVSQWRFLTPVKSTKKSNKKTKAIKRALKKIKQLEVIIKELES
tara:strand:- start:442 stop:720 length:279 start_codon:yes stop_codon:yes gene_type:complete